MRKLILQDYLNLASAKNLEYITGEVRLAQEKTRWKCLKDGYEWDVAYCTLNYGHGCPKCGLEKQAEANRLNIVDYEILGKNKGFKLISKSKNRKELSIWECTNGHIINMSYGCIAKGNNCSICSGRIKKTETDYLNLASSKNIVYIGPFPKNTSIKTNWVCSCGAKTYKAYNTIYANHYKCKSCGYKSITGKNSTSYNINLTDEERNKRRCTKENDLWRRTIYKRYNYKCIKCNKNGLLCAHHIFGYTDYPDLRYELSNGVCFCDSCHKKFHGLYGNKSNNFDQLLEFVPYLKDFPQFKSNLIRESLINPN